MRYLVSLRSFPLAAAGVAIALAGFAAAGLAGPASAQEATTRLQDATVVAKGSTITITRLPIHTSTGTILRDVTIELHVDAQGHVTLATDTSGRAIAEGMPAGGRVAGGHPSARSDVALRAVPSGDGSIELPQRPSPPIVMQIFRAGTYTAADGALVHLEDRGNDLIHHVPVWSLSADGGGLTSAIWYSGPPFMNPRARRLRSAGITGTDYAYGTSDAGDGGPFGSGAMIGVAQDGNTLKVVSFHRGCCTDLADPVAMLTYTYLGK